MGVTAVLMILQTMFNYKYQEVERDRRPCLGPHRAGFSGKESLSQELRGEEVWHEELRKGGGHVGIASRQKSSMCKGPVARGT